MVCKKYSIINHNSYVLNSKQKMIIIPISHNNSR